MHDLRSQKPYWTRMCLLHLCQGIECTFKSEKLCCGSLINCHTGRMEISSVRRMKRGNGNFKKTFFLMISIFKLFKNPEKKKVTREKKNLYQGKYIALYIWKYTLICWQSSTTLWAFEVKTMVYYCVCGRYPVLCIQSNLLNKWMNTTNLTPKSYIFSKKWQRTNNPKHRVSEFSLKKKIPTNQHFQACCKVAAAARLVYIHSILLYLLFWKL